jgi:hypothetical protein
MLMGLIPLETLPKYHDSTSEKKENLEKLVAEYNIGLRQVMDKFNKEKRDASAIFFDTNVLFRHTYTKEEIEVNSRSHCNKRKDCEK